MSSGRPQPVIVAGAGIAGLTAALAFAARGFPVRIFERSSGFREIGAGLQLSPNATRILDRLGVLEDLKSVAVRPEAVVLHDAVSLRELGRVPLGDFAERRWGAPYLVIHRADLQKMLIAAVARQDSITITTNAELSDVSVGQHGIAAEVRTPSGATQVRGQSIVGADGVWSKLRMKVAVDAASRFAGQIAWRRTLSARDPLAIVLRLDQVVSAFLHPGIHLIAYPIRAGSEVNLVAFVPTRESPEQDWSAAASFDRLRQALKQTAGTLAALTDDEGGWTAWPVYTATEMPSWVRGSLVLIGDAAHAMTPFAAQGAAMAIEDAYTLAEHAARGRGDLAAAYGAWEALRRPRIAQVAKRGAFNRLVWSAGGPVAWGRNLALKLRSPEHLAGDLDWLYGWHA